jgi:glycosyltransferase involved in cell wall biosynthesis
MSLVSIVIPLGPHESAHQTVFKDLRSPLLKGLGTISRGIQVVVVGTRGAEPSGISQAGLQDQLPGVEVLYLTSSRGRGKTLNKGAQNARGDYLWFVHADSRIGPDTVPALLSSIKKYPDALLYFNLKWLDDGPKYMKVNEIFANLRSWLLGLPFGDQGLCLRRDLFFTLGRYDEQVRYGEDHLFVWKARHHGIPLRSTGAALLTSARKYTDRNWTKRVLFYQKVWISQACREILKGFRLRRVRPAGPEISETGIHDSGIPEPRDRSSLIR